jgi:hypothetical protein
MVPSSRPAIRFIPMSTDENKIRFFGTLMPALLLLKASPVHFARHQIARQYTPRTDIASFIIANTDDAARRGDILVFIHRWHSLDFDPFAFAQAKTSLARITRLIRRAGYLAEPLGPLSPHINLPQLAAQAGLGTLSPFGLLVHPAFGPRLILTGLRTDYPLSPTPRWPKGGCNDCLRCIDICPQQPQQTGTIDLGLCQRCTQCLVVCAIGKGQS